MHRIYWCIGLYGALKSVIVLQRLRNFVTLLLLLLLLQQL